MRERLGLDRPLYVQYVDFLRGALTGDWGVSMVTGRPVVREVLTSCPGTIELTLVSLVLGAAFGLPLGIWAAINRNRLPDYLTRIARCSGSPSRVRLGDPPAADLRHPAALVPGDQQRRRHQPG